MQKANSLFIFFFLLYHSCGGKSMTKVNVFDFNVLIRLLFNANPIKTVAVL